ncbi:unnamed protein product, partial [Brenthis ino]
MRVCLMMLEASWVTSSPPRVGGPACTEDKFVVLVRARARRGRCGGGGAEGGGAGARRLLRSEHLRPRSVAPLAACSYPRPRPGPRRPQRRDAAHGM